ncbi:cell division protein FtsL [Desulfatibacillum aliphaticivorans]|uniref:cell division protein FtsL n=1 Tax=Desulfatibacillum aliphaticivorans TaxID=218208 RepID=UPI00041F80F5|nr:cell division protein FtsL [Desulfatibacillum aliphaticivorans]
MGGRSNDNEALRNWAYGLLAGILFLELFLFAWCRNQCTQRGYQITAELSHKEDLLDKQEELKVKLEHLRNPERISKIAEEWLGLKHPDPDQMVRP